MNRHLDSYLRMLAGPHDGRAGRFIDVRWPQPQLRTGMGKEYLPADEIAAAAAVIEGLAKRLDVYIGVALHDREAGDGSSVTRSHLAWADVYREDAQELLDAFPHAPTMTVASGSPGRRHAYWLLHDVVPIDEVMTANRKLAGAFAQRDPETGEWLRDPKSKSLIGGDLSAGVSRVSMLRPAGTYNYKRGERNPVRITDLAGSRSYDLNTLVHDLEDPKPPRPPYVPADGPIAGIRLENPTIDSAHQALKTLDARVWIPRLTGVELVLDDRMCCPFHEERTPSLKAYPNGSWYCYGCHRGGRIFDFAALLEGRDTRGSAFIELRADLARRLLGIELPTPDTLRRAPVPTA